MMLTLHVLGTELWDERKQEFLPETKERVISLEHSLVSLAKWECKWNKPFLSTKNKTRAETIDYIRFMTLTQNVDEDTWIRITDRNIAEVNHYIELPMTAAVFHDAETNSSSKKIITAETIYYWMIVNDIPFECQKWHLNRLLALIRFCNIESDPKKKKMTMNETMRSNAELNAARRKAWNTTG